MELEPAEFIFLIDMSGSMYWGSPQPIVLAQDALKLFLHSLPEGSKFNIVQFGSTHKSTFPQSVEYNEENLQIALDDVSTYHDEDRELGGTEIYSPLKHIFKQKCDENLTRQIFMLTDGEVGNTHEICKLIKDQVKGLRQRVHTIGMGNGASQELVEGAAKAGLGTHALISDQTLVEEKVIAALQKHYLPMKKVDKVQLVFENGAKKEL